MKSSTLIVLVAVLLFLGIVAVRAEPEPGVVTARKFVLVDGLGKTCAELRTHGTGAPSFILYDKQGEQRANLSVSSDGACWLHFNGDEQAGFVVLMGPSGHGHLVYNGADGKPRASLWIKDDTRAELKLHDAQGNSSFTAP